MAASKAKSEKLSFLKSNLDWLRVHNLEIATATLFLQIKGDFRNWLHTIVLQK